MRLSVLLIFAWVGLALAHSTQSYVYGSVSVHRTCYTRGEKLAKDSDIYFGSDYVSDYGMELNLNQTFQHIVGFGGAFTEAAAYTTSKLSEELQQQVVDMYFGSTGNRYTTGRIPINSCDFSLSSWSADDASDDFTLAKFDSTLSRDSATVIPFVKRALEAAGKDGNRTMRLFASPWSPPAWMKGNGQMTGSSTPGLKAGSQYSQAWADYLAKWFDAYKTKGIEFWGMTVQNEPEYAAPWEACVYTPEQQRDFIKGFLGPTMKAKHPEVNIMIYDHNKDHVVTWANTILSDPEAAKYVWGTAVHWYSGDDFGHLYQVHHSFPEHHILASEACNCPGVEVDNYDRAEKYAHDIIGDLNNFVEGWTDWNLVLDPTGGPNHLQNNCDSPLIADPNTQTIHAQPTYYIMGHFSRFLPPGSVRIAFNLWGPSVWPTVDNPNIEATAFLTPDSTVAIVLLNRGTSDVTVKLSLNGQAARLPSPGKSVSTFTFSAVLAA